jgi:plasmid stabilization system protein ParE
MEVKVIWAKTALIAINKILDYISEDSPANAGKVATDIENVFKKIIDQPFVFPPDKYRKSKDNSYRAFELHKIRISYKVELDRILVVRCRHTKQRPLYY